MSNREIYIVGVDTRSYDTGEETPLFAFESQGDAEEFCSKLELGFRDYHKTLKKRSKKLKKYRYNDPNLHETMDHNKEAYAYNGALAMELFLQYAPSELIEYTTKDRIDGYNIFSHWDYDETGFGVYPLTMIGIKND